MTEETKIKSQIKGYLKIRGIPSVHILQGLGCYPGLPDRQLLLQDMLVPLEIKAPGGKLNPAQEIFKALCESLNIPYILAHSVEELDEKLAEMLNYG